MQDEAIEIFDLDLNVEFFKREEYESIEWKDKQVGEYISLHPKQLTALEKLTDKKTLFIGYGGGARGGKSIVGCLWVLLNCFAYPGTRWLIGRSELKNLRITTLVTLKSLMESFKLSEGVHYRHDRVDNIITFSNESQIIFKDTAYKPSDNLGLKYGSLELTGAFIDESNETNIRIINVIFSRCGNYLNDKYQLTGKVLETFNPSKNHVHRLYWKPYKNSALPDDRTFIQALAKDNPSPQAQEYVRSLLRAGDEEMIERLVRGNFDYDDDPRILVTQTKINDFFSNTHVRANYEDAYRRYLCADIAGRGNDLFVIDVWLGEVLTLHVEIDKSTGGKVLQTIVDLKTEWGVPNSNIIVDADGIGSFLGGTKAEGAFLPGIIEFNANARPLEEENFENRATQYGYRLARELNAGTLHFKANLNADTQEKISEEIGQLKDKSDVNAKKKQLIKKKEIKENIGRSPDRLDALKLRMHFFYKENAPTETTVRSAAI